MIFGFHLSLDNSRRKPLENISINKLELFLQFFTSSLRIFSCIKYITFQLCFKCCLAPYFIFTYSLLRTIELFRVHTMFLYHVWFECEAMTTIVTIKSSVCSYVSEWLYSIQTMHIFCSLMQF